MQLDKWLAKEGRTKVWLEKQIGAKHRRVETILNGANITLQEVVDIDRITGGRVTQKDWLARARRK